MNNKYNIKTKKYSSASKINIFNNNNFNQSINKVNNNKIKKNFLQYNLNSKNFNLFKKVFKNIHYKNEIDYNTIFKNIKKQEEIYYKKLSIISNQIIKDNINIYLNIRNNIMAICYNFNKILELHENSLYSSIVFIDNIIKTYDKKLNEKKIYLICLICCFYSLKFVEDDAPEMDIIELNEFSENYYDKNEYLYYEVLCLKILKYNLNIPTLFDYVNIINLIGVYFYDENNVFIDKNNFNLIVKNLMKKIFFSDLSFLYEHYLIAFCIFELARNKYNLNNPEKLKKFKNKFNIHNENKYNKCKNDIINYINKFDKKLKTSSEEKNLVLKFKDLENNINNNKFKTIENEKIIDINSNNNTNNNSNKSNNNIKIINELNLSLKSPKNEKENTINNKYKINNNNKNKFNILNNLTLKYLNSNSYKNFDIKNNTKKSKSTKNSEKNNLQLKLDLINLKSQISKNFLKKINTKNKNKKNRNFNFSKLENNYLNLPSLIINSNSSYKNLNKNSILNNTKTLNIYSSRNKNSSTKSIVDIFQFLNNNNNINYLNKSNNKSLINNSHNKLLKKKLTLSSSNSINNLVKNHTKYYFISFNNKNLNGLNKNNYNS